MFFEENNNPITKNVDATTFQKITTLLCEKRKNLEESVSNNPLQEKKDELLLHIQEMHTFGITELDYQKYLASKK